MLLSFSMDNIRARVLKQPCADVCSKPKKETLSLADRHYSKLYAHTHISISKKIMCPRS